MRRSGKAILFDSANQMLAHTTTLTTWRVRFAISVANW